MRRALPIALLVLVGLIAVVLLSDTDDPPALPPQPSADATETPQRERTEPRATQPTQQTGALDVLVIDEHGDPISGAAVEVRDVPEVARGTTDASGIARLRELPVGHVTVVASATGRAASPRIDVALPAGVAVNETILLPRSHRLRARVIDAQGQPLEGVKVYADPNHGPEYREAVTGPDGRCEIDGIPAGGLEVMTALNSWDTYYWLRMPFDEELTLILPVRGAVEGRLIDRESGEPVSGAEVGWRPMGGGEFGAHATTDGDGRYRALLLGVPHSPGFIQARSPGYVQDGGAPLCPPEQAGGPWRADLTLQRTGIVDLVVRTEDGAPAADVWIKALGDRHYEMLEPDAAGRATLAWFAPGVVRLDVVGIGWDAVEPAAIVVPERGRELVSLVAKTRRPAVTVRGTVVDAAGLPLGDAIVSGGELAPVVADESGRFAVRVPDTAWSHDDSVYLEVRRGAEPPSSHRVLRSEVSGKQGTSDVTLTYGELAVVQGRLVDESGHAVPTAILRQVDTRIPVSRDGRFRFSTHAGTVWLSAEDASRAFFAKQFDVAPGEVTELGDAALTPRPILDGRVIDDVGAPVPGAIVSAAATVTRTGDDGGFRVPRNGRAIVVVATGHGMARIHSPPDANLTVVLQRHRVLSGTISFDDGTPVRGALVRAKDWESGPTGMTDDAGRFAIRGAVLPDPVWVRVTPLSKEHPQGVPTFFHDVELSTGDVSLVVSRGVAIRGCVLDAAGRPRPAMTIEAFGASGDSEYVAYTATGADGRFALQGVPPDNATHVRIVNGNDVLLERVVPAGGDDDVQFRFLPAAAISGELRVPDGEETRKLEIVATPIALPSVEEARNDVRAMVGPDGRFALACVEGQHYLLRLAHNRWFAQALGGGADVAAGTHDVLLVARRGVSYAGTFLRHDGAPPQTYVALRPRAPEPGWEDVRISVETEEDGTFRIDGLDPAVTYRVGARDYPYGGWIQYPDVRVPERGLEGVTLELE